MSFFFLASFTLFYDKSLPTSSTFSPKNNDNHEVNIFKFQNINDLLAYGQILQICIHIKYFSHKIFEVASRTEARLVGKRYGDN